MKSKPEDTKSITFTAAQIIAWAEEQKEYKDAIWHQDKTPSEVYEMAMNHIIHYVKHPVTEWLGLGNDLVTHYPEYDGTVVKSVQVTPVGKDKV